MKQDQFLDVVERDEAVRRWRAALGEEPGPLGEEFVPLDGCLGRILATDVRAPVDVPSFDRSDMDGFAVRAADTYGATEGAPARLALGEEEIPAGVEPRREVEHGAAASIATGGILPRGADAVVMVEDTEVRDGEVLVHRPVVPGAHVTFAGTDIGLGETVQRAGQVLTSRETGVLAACGVDQVPCRRRPRVAVLSTGNEIVPPGAPMRPGLVYDANARAIADSLREIGAEPLEGGVVPDDEEKLRRALHAALDEADMVVLSGGTSKGGGDLNYRLLEELEPGIVVHGVALKPGKPLCLGAAGRTPVVILPGFPTSALFTFHDVVAPLVRAWLGLPEEEASTVRARLPVRVPSVRGRREYLLVGLVRGADGLAAWPMGKGSGSVTTWARADGYTIVEIDEEGREAGEEVEVHLLGRGLEPADLAVIGSHCTGLDLVLGRLRRRGVTARVLAVGSSAGLEAARRGECDIAPVHLFDPDTGLYNEPFLDEGMELVPGYGRMQGVLFREDDTVLAGASSAADLVRAALAGEGVRMVNRQRGSGTRTLADRLLEGARPAGYAAEARSHNAVAAAVAQGRADWGVAIENVAGPYGLGFLPLAEERYDFIVPAQRAGRAAVQAFLEVLAEPGTREALREAGFAPADPE